MLYLKHFGLNCFWRSPSLKRLNDLSSNIFPCIPPHYFYQRLILNGFWWRRLQFHKWRKTHISVIYKFLNFVSEALKEEVMKSKCFRCVPMQEHLEIINPYPILFKFKSLVFALWNTSSCPSLEYVQTNEHSQLCVCQQTWLFKFSVFPFNSVIEHWEKNISSEKVIKW